MKKKNIFLGIFIVLILGIGGFYLIKKPKEESSSDAKKFATEYKEVSENNVFVYKTVDEIIKIMEKGTGVVYLGYPECPWCQEYVKYLDESAKESNIDTIYYCNTKKVKEENMENYYKLIALLSGHLQYTNEGEEWIYVPNVSFHIDGELIANNYETSKDTHNLTDPKDYWTEEEIKDLKETLKQNMEKVKTSRICTDCNK